MGRIRGKVIVYTPPDGQNVILAAINESEADEIGVTHNYVSQPGMEYNGHDDHVRYAHGMDLAPRGGKGRILFPINGYYHQHVIQPGGELQVGLRAACYQRVRVPAPGDPPVILDLEKDFIWYNNQSPDNNYHSGQVPHMRNWRSPQMANNVDERTDAFLKQVIDAMEYAKNRVKVDGKVVLTAQPKEDGTLSHWTVRFENAGETPFMATVVFENSEKNAGLGLESMGVPYNGSAAEQDIQANGNYGVKDKRGNPVRAKPGHFVRLGIRGLSHYRLALPDGGQVEVPLKKFKVESSQDNEKFFQLEEVLNKRKEKANKVRHYDNGNLINRDLEPLVYRGAAAAARAPCLPPKLVVKRVGDGESTPGGGWTIDLESKLPDHDDQGRVLGFVATLTLGGPRGWAPDRLPKKKFLAQGQRNVWFLPLGEQLGAHTAAPGERLLVSTGGLGWATEVILPKKIGEAFRTDAAKNEDAWAWYPHNESRAELDHEWVKKCRLGPDEHEQAVG